jgi:small conductance mechanosensitive channel
VPQVLKGIDYADLIKGVIAFALAWAVAHLLRDLISRALNRRGIRRDMVLLTTRVVYIILLSLGLLAFLSLTLQVGEFALTGFLTAALVTGLGLQDLFRNYVSGFYILLERNVKVGDVIESGGYTGEVTDVRMRVTYLRGESGELIVVPNGELFGKTVMVKQPPKPAAEPAPATRSRRRRRASGEGAQDDPAERLESLPG